MVGSFENERKGVAMGAWGTGILENDRTLDLMRYISEMNDSSLFAMTSVLVDSRSEEEAMLGVAIIDAAINGIDEDILGDDQYNYWFKTINDWTHSDWHFLQGCIFSAIYYAKQNMYIWNGVVNQRKRLNMYDKILERNGFKK